MSGDALRLEVHHDLAEIGQAAWDGLVGEGSPFLEYAWLRGLEETGCVGPEETGWIPRHASLWDGDTLVAAAPAYVKHHSMGEFVYDWSFAHAARRMGVGYYPKLVVGVPFTPVTGQRLLVAPGQDPDARRLQLVAGLHRLAEALGCHGLHLLFTRARETELATMAGGAERLQTQFMWTNAGYGTFDDFLARFRSKRRKAMRRERRAARELGLSLRLLGGGDLGTAPLDQMFDHYDRTCQIYGGWRYLNRDFWAWLQAHWADRLRLFGAFDGPRLVAGALCVEKADRMYGRYWGAATALPNLHFELCFYGPIERAIAQGLGGFEPGQGGRHKFRRGFEPELCRSVHWYFEGRLDHPLRTWLVKEARDVRASREAQLAESPLRVKQADATG